MPNIQNFKKKKEEKQIEIEKPVEFHGKKEDRKLHKPIE